MEEQSLNVYHKYWQKGYLFINCKLGGTCHTALVPGGCKHTVFVFWSQVNCRGESIMAFGYSCKSSRLAYGRNVLDNDSDLWYRSNPERLFFYYALGHHTFSHLLIPASLGLADTPCFLHSTQTMAMLRLLGAPAWPVQVGSSVNWTCCGTLAFFKNVYDHAIWLLKEYKNHMKDTEILAL